MDDNQPDNNPRSTDLEKVKRSPNKRPLPDRFKTPTGRPLNVHRKIFCKVLVDTGNSTHAAIEAGYTGPNPAQYGNTLKYQLKHVWQPMVGDRLESMEIKALQVIDDIMESGPAHLQLAAAKDVLDRGNNLRGTRQETSPHDGLTEKQLIQKITKSIPIEQARVLFPDLFPAELPEPIDITAETKSIN